MKKLMMAAVIVCAAAVAQAATFDWSTSEKGFGVVAGDVLDNGIYGASSVKADRVDQGITLAYVLTIMSGETVVGTASGTVEYGSLGKINTAGIEVSDAENGKTYNYILALTGTQDNLTSRGVDGDFDYSAATISAELKGTVTTSTMGNTALDAGVPTQWTVSGVAAVPEPTSGLLMLIGLAGLALRRRRA
jgi:hypothetical protein